MPNYSSPRIIPLSILATLLSPKRRRLGVGRVSDPPLLPISQPLSGRVRDRNAAPVYFAGM